MNRWHLKTSCAVLAMSLSAAVDAWPLLPCLLVCYRVTRHALQCIERLRRGRSQISLALVSEGSVVV